MGSNPISPAKNQVESKSHKVNSRRPWHRGLSLQCILRQYCDDIEKHWGKSPKFVPAIYSVEPEHGAWVIKQWLTSIVHDATIETSQKNNRFCKDPTIQRVSTKQVDWYSTRCYTRD